MSNSSAKFAEDDNVKAIVLRVSALLVAWLPPFQSICTTVADHKRKPVVVLWPIIFAWADTISPATLSHDVADTTYHEIYKNLWNDTTNLSGTIEETGDRRDGQHTQMSNLSTCARYDPRTAIFRKS